ncbi:MAG: DUF2513 domain-containing protein, partial [Candidatus Sulfotelmatobacter sp.]
MKRDMDLLRALLLKIEELPPAGDFTGNIEIEGHTPEEVAYHAQLAQDAGLIVARFLPPTNYFFAQRLMDECGSFREEARSYHTKEACQSHGFYWREEATVQNGVTQEKGCWV